MRLHRKGRLAALAALLVVAAGLFAVGVAIERHDERAERAAERAHQESSGSSRPENGSEGSASDEQAGKSGAGTGGEHAGASESSAQHAAEAKSERIFGVNPDATPLVISAVAISLLLAAALWLRPDVIALLWTVAALGLGSAVFDFREALHQIYKSRPTLVVIALAVAVLHLAASALAVVLTRDRPEHLRATAG